jgi:hypothetical protein
MVSVLPPNYRLKAKIIEKWGTISAAAVDLGIRQDRLGRIIHNRVVPNPREKRSLAWKLQTSISELFGEDTLD